MREKAYFLAGIFMFACGVFGSSAAVFYLNYPIISFHVLIGVVFMYFGLKWAMKPFETEKKIEEGVRSG